MRTKGTIANHTVGVDLGDRKSAISRLDGDGEVVERRTIATTREFLESYFRALPKARVVLEVGTHSPWVSRLLQELGHEVIVANPSKIRAQKGRRTSDRIDAEWLARQGRADPKLLFPIEHRGERAQADLVLLGTRDCLVKCRTLLINHVRGSVKPLAGRIPKCSAESFHRTAGVGPMTSLGFALVVEDPERFRKRRPVGAYVGLVPQLEDSGDLDSELGISKAGNGLCRKYLVQAAQYILGSFGPDTDLRRWGMGMIGESKSTKVKKRAVVAVARKLSVLMLRLWVTGERYEPLYNSELRRAA
jgi:transposase